MAACPKGEYKFGVGSTASCKKCAFGVTTAKEASVSVAACTGGLITNLGLAPNLAVYSKTLNLAVLGCCCKLII
jgi:hypothetical protein